MIFSPAGIFFFVLLHKNTFLAHFLKCEEGYIMKHMTFHETQRGSLAFIALILIAVVLVFIAQWMRSPQFPLRQNSDDTLTEEERIANGVRYRIEITEKGFVPGVLTVEPYDTVAFINRDRIPHFPVAGDSSGRFVCESFGQGRELQPGEGYAVVFKEQEECGFHDALSAQFSDGTIVIKMSR